MSRPFQTASTTDDATEQLRNLVRKLDELIADCPQLLGTVTLQDVVDSHNNLLRRLKSVRNSSVDPLKVTST